MIRKKICEAYAVYFSFLPKIWLYRCALNGEHEITDADLRGLLEFHVDVWIKCMKESFVNRKYFVEVLGVHIHFVTQIRHGRCDVGCMIGRHLSKRFEGEDADVFVARCDAGGKGRHGYGFCCEAMRLKFVGLFRKKSPKKACCVASYFLGF